MNEPLLLIGFVVLICILANRFLGKIPIPSLLIFIGLGMFFGENGVLKIAFDNYDVVNITCSICLIFIMFYGGFGTNLKAARPVLAPSIVLSTLGVAGTAGALALFAHWVLGLPLLESFLIGSVISSTDAASVFNILRSQKLALKYHTDSLLEIESGSNDPMSYMLTTVAVALLAGQSISVPLLLAQQMVIGLFFGALFGWLAVKLLHQQLLPLSGKPHRILTVYYGFGLCGSLLFQRKRLPQCVFVRHLDWQFSFASKKVPGSLYGCAHPHCTGDHLFPAGSACHPPFSCRWSLCRPLC